MIIQRSKPHDLFCNTGLVIPPLKANIAYLGNSLKAFQICALAPSDQNNIWVRPTNGLQIGSFKVAYICAALLNATQVIWQSSQRYRNHFFSQSQFYQSIQRTMIKARYRWASATSLSSGYGTSGQRYQGNSSERN